MKNYTENWSFITNIYIVNFTLRLHSLRCLTHSNPCLWLGFPLWLFLHKCLLALIINGGVVAHALIFLTHVEDVRWAEGDGTNTQQHDGFVRGCIKFKIQSSEKWRCFQWADPVPRFHIAFSFFVCHNFSFGLNCFS